MSSGKRAKNNFSKRNIFLLSLIVVFSIIFIILLFQVIIMKKSEILEISSLPHIDSEFEIKDIQTINDIIDETVNDIVNEDQPPAENISMENKTNSSSSTDNTHSNESTASYYIKINNQANVVTIYTKDSNGEYTVPYKAMICSTGSATPQSGKYTIKSKWRWLGLFGDVYGQYVTQITGNILFHSVPYTEKGNPASLEYWEFDKLGTAASMGCIRLQVKDTKWIYDNIPRGTIVEFYSSSDPGPLGKPSAPQISSNETCRNWDPTDTADGNPWFSQNSETSSKENDIDNTITNSASDSTNTITNSTGDSTNTVTNSTGGSTNTVTNSTNTEDSSLTNTVINTILQNTTSIINSVTIE